MTINAKHYQKKQPIPKFYRADPFVFMFLVENKLKAPHVTFLLYFMMGMDRENIFETSDGLAEHLGKRFRKAKNHVSEHLKYMRELNIFCEISPKAIRINPYVANKVQDLASFWEFEDIKLGAFSESYDEWAVAYGMPERMPSFIRLKKGEIAVSKKREKLIDRNEHEQIVTDLTDEMQRLIAEYTQDCEQFLAQRTEYEMKMERLENELKYKSAEYIRIEEKMDRMERMMQNMISELRKHDPEKAEEIHLKVIKGGKGQSSETLH